MLLLCVGADCTLFLCVFAPILIWGYLCGYCLGLPFLRVWGYFGVTFSFFLGGVKGWKMHFAPLLLAVFGVIMIGKCTVKRRLHLIYIAQKCLNYNVFLAFIPVFAHFFVCVAHLCVLTWMYVLNVWLFMLMSAVDYFQMLYPTLAMLPLATPKHFFAFLFRVA